MDKRMAQFIDFNISEKGEHRIVANMTISEKLPSFEGHFPGDPILPAVSIIDISLHLLSQVFPQVSHSNVQMKRSKFMSIVRPNQNVDLIAESEDGKDWRVSWKLAENQSKLAQVHLAL